MRAGPRLDAVLRSSVLSKVGDLLWRKESADAATAESSSLSDENSDGEPPRGRSRGSLQLSRTPSRRGPEEPERLGRKSYLDVGPSFLQGSSQARKSAGDQAALSSFAPPSRPHSRSPRFDRMRPPTLDVQNIGPKKTPPRQIRPARDSDASDTDSRKTSHTNGSKAAGERLNAVLSLQTIPPPRPRHFSTTPSRRPPVVHLESQPVARAHRSFEARSR